MDSSSDYTCATRNEKAESELRSIRARPIIPAPHLTPCAVRLWRRWRRIGGLANCFLRSPTLRVRASRSQATVSVGEASEHGLVGKVVVAKWVAENVALPRTEGRGLTSAEPFSTIGAAACCSLNPCEERTRVEYTKRTWEGNPTPSSWAHGSPRRTTPIARIAPFASHIPPCHPGCSG